MGFVEQREIDAEGGVGGFGAGDGLEDEIDGRAVLRWLRAVVVTWARTQLWVGMS